MEIVFETEVKIQVTISCRGGGGEGPLWPSILPQLVPPSCCVSIRFVMVTKHRLGLALGVGEETLAWRSLNTIQTQYDAV